MRLINKVGNLLEIPKTDVSLGEVKKKVKLISLHRRSPLELYTKHRNSNHLKQKACATLSRPAENGVLPTIIQKLSKLHNLNCTVSLDVRKEKTPKLRSELTPGSNQKKPVAATPKPPSRNKFGRVEPLSSTQMQGVFCKYKQLIVVPKPLDINHTYMY